MRYNAKHVKQKTIQYYKKSAALLIAMVLVITVSAGTSLSYLIDQSTAVTNTFQPANVGCEVYETFNGTAKSNVTIKNTSNVPEYIRASVIVTWKDNNGVHSNVYGKKPKDTDYTINYDLSNGWVQGSDGFYYWTSPVKSEIEAPNDCMTGVLIISCTSNGTKTVGDTTYYLSVEIVAEAIQANPVDAVDSWDNTKVEVEANANGTLTVTNN